MKMHDGPRASVGPIGPVDATRVPRFAGIATFARLPRLEDVGSADVAVVGVPFDSGVSYRPGARFGPAAVREGSRLLWTYHRSPSSRSPTPATSRATRSTSTTRSRPSSQALTSCSTPVRG